MPVKLLLAALLAAAPARAEMRQAPSLALPPVVTAPLTPGLPALTLPAALPNALAIPDLRAASLALPSAALALPQAAIPAALPAAIPAAAAAAPQAHAAQPLPERLTAVSQGVAQAVERLGSAAQPAGDGARAAGDGIERLLTGERTFDAPAVDAANGDSRGGPPPRSAGDAQHAASAVMTLAAAADDLGAALGHKAASITGAEFAADVKAAAAQEDAKAQAPSPAAAEAAKIVRAQVVRVVDALIAKDAPAKDSLPRLLSVWQVMGQELAARAAEHGTIAAVVADAKLFAEQVEASVAPAPEAVKPEDPDGQGQHSVEGSVFGWRPIKDSPGHGLAPLDALIRRALDEEGHSPYAKGFELPGAPRRQDAKIFFYGERHTDGGLIAANMRRLVNDAKPGGKMVVLVEGYTGWELKGFAAVEYLAKRGLDTAALDAKAQTEITLRGWDTIDRYDASKHPLLQHHMDLLELNRMAFSDARGASYYWSAAKAAWRAIRGWRTLWQSAIVARNADLDAAVSAAAAQADETGATVHVIAGTDHLMQRPRLNALLPQLFRPSIRNSLKAALRGRAYWASQPRHGGAPPRLVIMGPPAAGKGTLAKRLVEDDGLVHISAGDLLRQHAQTHPEIADIMKRGDLVPAELVVNLVRERLRLPDVKARGFLLDGFPRRLEEAEALSAMLAEEGIALDAAIKLELPEKVLLKRILARGRADDTETTFRNRMKVYARETVPAMARVSRGTKVLKPRLRDDDKDGNYQRLRRLLDRR